MIEDRGLEDRAPADNFADAYRALEVSLHDQGLFDAYYVERADTPAIRLAKRLEVGGAYHILYSGQPKSGKTTELLRLVRMLGDRHFVVFLSALEDLQPTDVNVTDILLLIASRLCAQALDAGVEVESEVQSDLSDWFLQSSGEVFQERVKEKTKGFALGAKLKYLVAEIGGTFSVDSTLRETTRTRLRPRVAELADRIELLCRLVCQSPKVGREPLIIVDDLEKVPPATQRNLFYDEAPTLTRPRCRTIYAIHRALNYDARWKQITNIFPNPVEVPYLRTANRDGTPHSAGLDLLRRIILRRMSDQLFAPGALDMLLASCNGVLADLQSVTMACCLDAMVEEAPAISPEMVARQRQILTDDFGSTIRAHHYPILDRIHQTHAADNDDSLSELMFQQAVLEYRDESKYYDVHPAVVPLLEQRARALAAKSLPGFL